MALLFSFVRCARYVGCRAQQSLEVDEAVSTAAQSAANTRRRHHRRQQRRRAAAAARVGALSGVPGTTAPSSPCVRTPIGSTANSTVHQMTT